MQITLNQDEIHEAVVAYVASQIALAPNQRIEVEFTAGRAPNGLSATLNISAQPLQAAKPVMRMASSSPAPKPKPEPIVEPEPTKEPEVAEERVEDAIPDAPEEAPESPDAVEEAVAEEAEEAPVAKASPFKKMAKPASEETADADATPAPAKKSIFSKAS